MSAIKEVSATQSVDEASAPRVVAERPVASLASLVASLSDAALVVEPHSGRILHWNAAAAALFGYSLDDAPAAGVTALVPPGHRGALYADLGRRVATDAASGPPVLMALPGLRQDGSELAIELSASPLAVEQPSGPVVLLLVRDVSERKRVDDAVRAIQAQFARDEAVTIMARTVAHELGQPLTVLLGMLELWGAGRVASDAAPLRGLFQDAMHDLADRVTHLSRVARYETREFGGYEFVQVRPATPAS